MKTSVKIVKIDSFCTGKFEHTILLQEDFKNLDEIRKNKIYKQTLNKITDPLALNEKEFKQCQSPTQ